MINTKTTGDTLELSLAEHLSKTRKVGGLPETTYKAFLAEDASRWGSWAIWGESTGDLSVFDPFLRPWERLRSDVFVMGGNTGVVGKGGMPRSGNFHTPGHRPDGKLRNALSGTPLEGAFLSDVVKDYPTKDSAPLRRDIKNGVLDIVRHVVDPLEHELELLGSPQEVIVVLLGDETTKVWDTVMSHENVPHSLLDRLTVITGLPHHSKAAPLKEPVQELLMRPIQRHRIPGRR